MELFNIRSLYIAHAKVARFLQLTAENTLNLRPLDSNAVTLRMIQLPANEQTFVFNAIP